MPKSFSLGAISLTGVSIKDPRVAVRAVIGLLLAANLAAAVLAFRPFGGSAADLRLEQAALGNQLTELEKRAGAARRLVDKVEMARREGDDFLRKYMVDRRTMASAIAEELNRMAKEAGVRALPGQLQLDPIEGSDTLEMVSITAGYEGTYANLKKLVEMVDKSPRFLIVENMTVVSPQQLARPAESESECERGLEAGYVRPGGGGGDAMKLGERKTRRKTAILARAAGGAGLPGVHQRVLGAAGPFVRSADRRAPRPAADKRRR